MEEYEEVFRSERPLGKYKSNTGKFRLWEPPAEVKQPKNRKAKGD